MGNGIQIGHRPTQAEMTAAKYDRDFYVVFLKYSDGPAIPETSMRSATLEQLVDDIIGTEMEMPESIDRIVYFNPAANVSRMADREVADAVAERTHEMRQTPHVDSVIDWLDSWNCDYYADDEYLQKCAENDLLTYADDRNDYRRMAAE